MYTHSLKVRQCILNALTYDVMVALLFSSPSLSSSLLLPLLITFIADFIQCKSFSNCSRAVVTF